jgi:hypothetical protein
MVNKREPNNVKKLIEKHTKKVENKKQIIPESTLWNRLRKRKSD